MAVKKSPEASSSNITVITTRAEAETLLAEIVGCCAQVKRLQAELAEKIAAVRTAGEEEIKLVEKDLAARKAALEAWGWSVQKVEFSEKRSQEWSHGTVGFRWGKPKLALLSKMTWEKVLERLKGRYQEYIRTVEEVNKEKILAESSSDNPLLEAADHSAMGVKKVQEETFFIEPKN